MKTQLLQRLNLLFCSTHFSSALWGMLLALSTGTLNSGVTGLPNSVWYGGALIFLGVLNLSISIYGLHLVGSFDSKLNRRIATWRENQAEKRRRNEFEDTYDQEEHTNDVLKYSGEFNHAFFIFAFLVLMYSTAAFVEFKSNELKEKMNQASNSVLIEKLETNSGTYIAIVDQLENIREECISAKLDLEEIIKSPLVPKLGLGNENQGSN